MEIIAMSMPKDVLRGQESLNVTIKDNDTVNTVLVNDDHPRWNNIKSIVDQFRAGELSNSEAAEEIHKLHNLKAAAAEKIKRLENILDGRMVLSGNEILVDHEPIDPVLESHILRMLNEEGTPRDERNWRAFARFVENLYANSSEYVRNQLFGWMSYENLHGHGLTLTDDGCFIGYKGCEGTVDEPRSVFSGTAIVDGVTITGKIPNKVGSIIEMPRSKVQFDPAIGCSYGLHVGTYNYASNWARGVLLTVKVNPRDVVSVPTECDAQKIRTCRYEVLDTTEKAFEGVLWEDEDYDDNDFECDGYCDDCDCNDNEENDETEHDNEETNDNKCVNSSMFETLKVAAENNYVVKIKYQSQNDKTPRSRRITIDDMNRYYVDGVDLDLNSYRTYIMNNISDAQIIDSNFKGCNCNGNNCQSRMNHPSQGGTNSVPSPIKTVNETPLDLLNRAYDEEKYVTFIYNGQKRNVEVSEYPSGLNVQTFDLDHKEPRTFYIPNMINIELI